MTVEALPLAVEIWEALKYSIDTNERTEAADALINLLIDHDFEVVDIKEAFKGDKTINSALRGYVAAHEDELVEDEPEEDVDSD